MKRYFLKLSMVGLMFISLVPTALLAQTDNNSDTVVINGSQCDDIQSCVNAALSFINKLIPILIGIALIMFIYGIYKYFSVGGDEKQLAASKSYMFYGIISLAVILGVWTLVRIVVASFFPGAEVVPQFSMLLLNIV